MKESKIAIGKEIPLDEIEKVMCIANVDRDKAISHIIETQKEKELITDCIIKTIKENNLIQFKLVENVLYGELRINTPE